MAWVRTGLTAFAVAVGAGKIVPSVTHGSRLPFELLGAGFALLGVAVAAYAVRSSERLKGRARPAYAARPYPRYCLTPVVGSRKSLIGPPPRCPNSNRLSSGPAFASSEDMQ